MLCETLFRPVVSYLIRQKIRDWTIQPRIFYVLCVMSV